MKPSPFRRAVFKHGLKTWTLMFALLTPLILLGDHIPNWLFYALFFGVFFAVIMPVHFGLGPIGRRLGRDLNEAAVLEDRKYRRSLGPQAKPSEIDASEKKN